MHQPNVFVNPFLGYTMYDYESDAPLMWPEEQQYPSSAEMFERLMRNPEEAATRGKWGDLEFLSKVWTDINPKAKNTQFADYHGHGWNFRAVFKKDRKGNLLDAKGNIVEHDDPDKFKKAVHMKSLHLELGMHCVDCHFSGDAHGNGYIPFSSICSGAVSTITATSSRAMSLSLLKFVGQASLVDDAMLPS